MSGRTARRGLVDALTGLAFVIALFAVLGYTYGAQSLEGFQPHPDGLHTAIACLILSVGVAANHSMEQKSG